MTTRIQDNLIKAIFIIVLFIVLIFHSVTADAQASRNGESLYKGFVASFGTRSANVSSDIKALSELDFSQAGGRIGLIFGNSIVRSKVGLLGYYSSTGNIPGTIDLYQSNIAVHFYPLSLFMKRSLVVEPYITAGLDYDQYRLYGYYLNREPGETNYSQAEAPYLGKIKEVNASIGAGLEVKLKDDYDFIHLFTEVRYGNNLSRKTHDATFGRTEMRQQLQAFIGVSFGAYR